MILLNVFDIKDTMAHLLLSESFDEFWLEEVKVTTFACMEIKGRRNSAWYDDVTEEKFSDLLFWKEVRPFIFSYIKGKRTPSSFFISLKLPYGVAKKMLEDTKVLQMVGDGKLDLLLHFRFEKGKLSVVTGVSYQEFTMDKYADVTWDNAVKKFLKRLKLAYEE